MMTNSEADLARAYEQLRQHLRPFAGVLTDGEINGLVFRGVDDEIVTLETALATPHVVIGCAFAQPVAPPVAPPVVPPVAPLPGSGITGDSNVGHPISPEPVLDEGDGTGHQGTLPRPSGFTGVPKLD